MQSQSWLGKVFGPRRPESAHPTDPPEPGLGYLCLLLVKIEKKVSLSGTAVDRADRPVGWSRQVAGTILLFTCVVYQNQSLQMRQRVTCLAAEIRPFSVFFRLKNPARQRAPPSSCSVVLDTKNVQKRFVPRRGQSTRTRQIIQAQKGQGWDIFGSEPS